MNPASKDITTYLATQNDLALTIATNLFFSRIPERPDNCVTVMDNAGEAPLLSQKKLSTNYHYSSISVYVRHAKYELGWELINKILQLLHGEGNLEIGGTLYTLIKAMSDPQVLTYDDNNRVIFLLNFEIQRRTI